MPARVENSILFETGSHTVLVLLEHGATVTLIDNLSNSFPRVFDHMTKLAGDKASKMKYVKVRDVMRTQTLVTTPCENIRLFTSTSMT